MSRVGKQILTVPANTQITVSEGSVTVKGPKGELKRYFKPIITINVNGSEVTLTPNKNDNPTRALWGTYTSHVKNMIKGVSEGFTKKLILDGIGFKADVAGTNLNMALGFSHPVVKTIPAGVTVVTEKGTITVSGADKEAVGQFAAQVRALKKPEPYKGKGFRYDTEVIRRKQGKKAA